MRLLFYQCGVWVNTILIRLSETGKLDEYECNSYISIRNSIFKNILNY